MQTNTQGIIELLPAPEGYTLFNMGISQNITHKHWKCLVSVEIENLLNTRYREYLDRLRFYSDAMGRNIITRVQWFF